MKHHFYINLFKLVLHKWVKIKSHYIIHNIIFEKKIQICNYQLQNSYIIINSTLIIPDYNFYMFENVSLIVHL